MMLHLCLVQRKMQVNGKCFMWLKKKKRKKEEVK